ncbi:UDP-phosphate galactose phosphotransferase [Moorella thermoacetica]|uniref:Undecaprenyl-phosphate galactosephosphotransferase n=1 Tax=Moorella thermoacetica (strain ATCC 39073 / JCM 9320) TaxID=264732 RepID=Q2RKP5_MOOTA|nr:sugar transferase [Moorella thermoacetica]AKX93413.1 UDP-N-acetylgalactosamine-undecaprenyl-phosphate N-acetylgalactosaminephosphotransferase [Moorella thermoacetica]AKX96063.1 UDP-N-acetylgalactosamine-undecaprenyl-phosphate N-acetylgalactosaminephosphotransferase [Moorella thermoacetica]OIQ55275.1 UDP-N-acetylgalactosamine-undecaprenyl-phosphate N-acetylgalactosaminephosphotransferase [Moorella thermoacetica]QCZ99873.1 UDP-N-acetylgalactosamine-undecaprenyl-phosphate N-acetylgalactosaminep
MRWTKVVKIAGDLFLVNFSFWLAFWLRFGGSIPAVNWHAYRTISIWITLAAFVLFYSYGLYVGGRYRWIEIFAALVWVVALTILSGLGISYMLQKYAFPRSVFLLTAPIQLALLSIWRYAVWRFSIWLQGTLTLVVIGPTETACQRAREVTREDNRLYQVAGLVVEGGSTTSEIEFPVLGTYHELPQALDASRPGAVLFCDGIPLEYREMMLKEIMARNLPAFIVPDIYEIFLAQARLGQLDGIPVFRVDGFIAVPSRAWKRAFDIALSLCLSIIAIPLILLAALAIKIESPGGPVFYRQQRVGQGGRVFQLIKLRTMVPDAEKITGPVLATDKDPRITRVGRILRATRIDELPQLWNVLKGEMSFIGPRPERPFFVEQFKKEVPGYDWRHQLKVGITGLAQVQGRYSTTPADKLRYDLLYAKTISPLSDAQILLHTLKVMLMRDKAS